MRTLDERRDLAPDAEAAVCLKPHRRGVSVAVELRAARQWFRPRHGHGRARGLCRVAPSADKLAISQDAECKGEALWDLGAQTLAVNRVCLRTP